MINTNEVVIEPPIMDNNDPISSGRPPLISLDVDSSVTMNLNPNVNVHQDPIVNINMNVSMNTSIPYDRDRVTSNYDRNNK